jgi:hypothetical protein
MHMYHACIVSHRDRADGVAVAQASGRPTTRVMAYHHRGERTFLQPERFSWPLSFPHTSNEVHPFGLSISITWPSGQSSVRRTIIIIRKP